MRCSDCGPLSTSWEIHQHNLQCAATGERSYMNAGLHVAMSKPPIVKDGATVAAVNGEIMRLRRLYPQLVVAQYELNGAPFVVRSGTRRGC